jgi:hypothetical protein
MPTYIVTEGKSDKVFLEKILAPELMDDASLRIEVAGGSSALVSFSRTLLRNTENRLIVVSDADSLNPESRRRFIEMMLKEISPSEENRWYLFMMIPEFEVLLFENTEIFKEIFGREIDEISFVKGKYESKKTISEFMNAKEISWNGINLSALRKTEIMQKLIQVIYTFQDREKHSSSLRVAA